MKAAPSALTINDWRKQAGKPSHANGNELLVVPRTAKENEPV